MPSGSSSGTSWQDLSGISSTSPGAYLLCGPDPLSPVEELTAVMVACAIVLGIVGSLLTIFSVSA